MRLEQLRYFIDVANTGSINFTAKKFFATQQSINAALKRLEEEVGYTLLKRSSSGVCLTKGGQLFLDYAIETVDGYNRTLDLLAQLNQSKKSKDIAANLRIASGSVLCDVAFPKILSSFHGTYPKIDLKVAKLDNEDIIDAVEREEYDMGFLTANIDYIEEEVAKHESLTYKNIMEDQVVVCLKSNSAYAGEKEVDPVNFLRDVKLSYYNMVPSKRIKEYSYNSAMHISDDAEFHKKLIEQDLCVTLMPKFAYEELFKSKRFTCVFIKDTVKIMHCIIMKKSRKTPAVMLFADAVENYMLVNYPANKA